MKTNRVKAKRDSGGAAFAVFFLLLLAAGMGAGYVYFSKSYARRESPPSPVRAETPAPKKEDFAALKIYYPISNGLVLEERRAGAEDSLADSAMREFFKGPIGGSFIPRDVKLLGTYTGEDGILYVNLSDELRLNFQGGAMEEYLLLRGIYETTMSNVNGVSDVKLLVEGREIDSAGGHLSLISPLGESVSETVEEGPESE